VDFRHECLYSSKQYRLPLHTSPHLHHGNLHWLPYLQRRCSHSPLTEQSPEQIPVSYVPVCYTSMATPSASAPSAVFIMFLVSTTSVRLFCSSSLQILRVTPPLSGKMFFKTNPAIPFTKAELSDLIFSSLLIKSNFPLTHPYVLCTMPKPNRTAPLVFFPQ